MKKRNGVFDNGSALESAVKISSDMQTLARPNVKEKACSFENDWCGAITFLAMHPDWRVNQFLSFLSDFVSLKSLRDH